MLAISYSKNGYFLLRHYDTRKEATESLKWEILNVRHEFCFGEEPFSQVIKDRELPQVFEDNPYLKEYIKSCNLNPEDFVRSYCPLFVFLPKLMRDFDKIVRHFNRKHENKPYAEILKMAKEGFADLIKDDYKRINSIEEMPDWALR